MIHKSHITVRDRLLAVGLVAIVVVFSFPLALGYHQTSRAVAADYSIFVVAIAASIALVFDSFAFWHGSGVQKLLAVLFALPLLAFIVLSFQIWMEMFY